MPKSLKLLPKPVQKSIHHFSLSSKYRILGSNSIRGMIYPSDIDVEVSVDKSTRADALAHELQSRVKNMDKDVIFLEFKAGLCDGVPMKWSKSEVLAGSKCGKSIAEALTENTIIKLDLIVPVGETYSDVGEVYMYKQHKMSNEELEKELEADIDEYKGSNKLKALKRLYSVLKFEPTKNKVSLDELEDFFNSIVGYANKIKSDLEIIIRLLEHGKKLKDLRPFIDDCRVRLGSIARLKVKLTTKADIQRTIANLQRYINDKSEVEVKKFI
jgi:predicted nucleotidyltransferase